MDTKLLAQLTRFCNRNKIKADDAEKFFSMVLKVLTLREAGLTVSIPKQVIKLKELSEEERVAAFPIDINKIPNLMAEGSNQKFRHLVCERWIQARVTAGHFSDTGSLVGVQDLAYSKISMIKAVREVLGLGLADAKMWVEARSWR